jgi:hypothetical protein
MPAVVARPWPSLLLVHVALFVVLVGSCCAETNSSVAADDELGTWSHSRRRAASVMVPITILKSAVSEGAGTYVCVLLLWPRANTLGRSDAINEFARFN